MKAEEQQKWSAIYKIIVSVLGALAAAFGLQSCAHGDATATAVCYSLATSAALMLC
jgi:hypothetical protein